MAGKTNTERKIKQMKEIYAKFRREGAKFRKDLFLAYLSDSSRNSA